MSIIITIIMIIIIVIFSDSPCNPKALILSPSADIHLIRNTSLSSPSVSQLSTMPLAEKSDESTTILVLQIKNKTKIELSIAHIEVILNNKWLTDEVITVNSQILYISSELINLIIVDYQLLYPLHQ